MVLYIVITHKNLSIMTHTEKIVEASKALGVLAMVSKSDVKEFNFDTPTGMVFCCSGTHAIVCNGAADALYRLGYGIEKCEEEDCDICSENYTFDAVVENNSDLFDVIYKP